MKRIRILTMVAILFLLNPAFAENEGQQIKPVTELQVKQAIDVLLRAGVLSLDGTALVLRKPTILQQLYNQGHVSSGKAETDAICAKE